MATRAKTMPLIASTSFVFSRIRPMETSPVEVLAESYQPLPPQKTGRAASQPDKLESAKLVLNSQRGRVSDGCTKARAAVSYGCRVRCQATECAGFESKL